MSPRPDLLIAHADVVVTMNADRREIRGGWVAITNGFVTSIGGPGSEPEASRVVAANGCVVTPGFINTHHHIYQNLTRSFAPALAGILLECLVWI